MCVRNVFPNKLPLCFWSMVALSFKRGFAYPWQESENTSCNKLRNTNTRSKHLSSSERLQNIIFKVSSTTENANGDLLFTKTAATDFGRNSGNIETGWNSRNIETGCSSQNKNNNNSNLGFLSNLFLVGKKKGANLPVIILKDLNSFNPYNPTRTSKWNVYTAWNSSFKKSIFSAR